MLVIGNIKMEFRHPNYYKELRKRNKLDQAISGKNSTECKTRSPGPGPKPRYTPTGILLGVDLGEKPQANDKQQADNKQQASSFRTNLVK